MSAATAVATLNQLGGKDTAGADVSKPNTRFRARLTGIFDAPEQLTDPVTRRSLGGLQQLDRPPSTKQTSARNSWSPPNDSPVKQFQPVQPKKTVFRKTRGQARESPLKKYGNDIHLEENPNVDLNDSPATRTRSKQPNPPSLGTKPELRPTSKLAENDLERPRKSKNGQDWTNMETVSATVPVSTQKRSKKADLVKSNADGRAKRARTDNWDGEQVPTQKDSPNEDVQGENASPAPEAQQDESIDPERAQDEHEIAPEGRDKEHDSRGGQEQTSGTAIAARSTRAPIEEDEEEQEDGDGDRGEQAEAIDKILEQIEEDKKKEKQEFDECRAEYVKGIEMAVEMNHCKKYWLRVGSAAGMTSRKVDKSDAKMKPGKLAKAFLRSVRKTREAYEVFECRLASEQTNIQRLIEKLIDSKQNLQVQNHKSTDRKLILDIYYFVIPHMVSLLKSFLRARYCERPLTISETKELVQLLDLTIEICELARTWTPRPGTLKYGVKRWLRTMIAPNLTFIHAAFKPTVETYDWVKERRERISSLAERSAIARRRLHERLEEQRRERRSLWRSHDFHASQEGFFTGSGHLSSTSAQLDQRVYDVDEVEAYSQPQPSREPDRPDMETGYVSTKMFESRSRLVREPTVDLPPPPAADFNEEERVALLNGLQRYTGHDRYNDILGDPELGDVLRKRDLDALMNAAISYSRMMASKMGAETYHADRSLAWLRSADAEVEDGASVVL